MTSSDAREGAVPASRELEFWRGEFGDAYLDRNQPREEQVRARVRLWSQILDRTVGAPPREIVEVGANLGLNLRALRQLTAARLIAIEPNARARERLSEDQVVRREDIHDGAGQAMPLGDASADLVFTCGVLIHVHPDDLLTVCREIHRTSRRYIACIEYFSVRLEEVHYRGQDGLLFKRDFGGFYLDHFPDLRIVDYGFAWRRATGLDDLNWWLFEKGSG